MFVDGNMVFMIKTRQMIVLLSRLTSVVEEFNYI